MPDPVATAMLEPSPDPETLNALLPSPSEDVNALSNWMKHSAMWARIKDQPIWNIVLPGTHDSGSYSGWNSGYVRNQTLDIGEQVARGIRFLDLRVQIRPDVKPPDGYVMAHNTYPLFHDQQKFSDALEQLGKFASQHPHEIIVAQMILQGQSGGKPCVDFQDYCIKTLEPHLVILDVDATTKEAEGTDYTPAKMLTANKSVIIISPHGQEPTRKPTPRDGRSRYYQWKTKYVDADITRDSWDCRQTFLGVLCDMTPQEKVKFLKEQIPGWLRQDSDYPGKRTAEECPPTDNPKDRWEYVGKYFNYAAATIWTPNIIADTVSLLQPALLGWLWDWENRSDVMKKMNIIYLDAVFSSIGVFPAVDVLVPHIIDMNFRKGDVPVAS